jgi:glycosyltransferase involved in cell wall biosynthesis
MNILQTCFSRSWGGLELQALDETLQLQKRGHRLWLACIPGSRIEQEAHRQGVTVLPLRVTGYVHPVLLVRLARFIADRHVDVLHCQLSKDIATVVPAMRLSGRRVPVILSRRMGSYIGKKDFFHRLTYRHVTRVLAISSVIHRNVLDTTPVTPDRVMTLHHAVDTEKFSLKNTDRRATRQELRLDDAMLAVGFVGRFSPGKGHEEFLHAAHVIAKDHPHVRFVIVGEASRGEEAYARHIRMLCCDLGLVAVVLLVGFRSDIPDVMAAFDIFAFPSHAESFGAVLIEAMALELPVVSTNCDGVLDIVVDGVTGLYVSPRDAPGLARALTQLIDDPSLRTAMGKAGRRRVEELFDQRKQIDRLEEVYREVIASGGCDTPRR